MKVKFQDRIDKPGSFHCYDLPFKGFQTLTVAREYFVIS